MATKMDRYLSGVMEAAWLAAVSIVPVFFNVYSSRIFEPDKITLLRSLALVSVAAWLLKLIEAGAKRWRDQDTKQSLINYLWHFPMLAPVFGLIIVYIISTIFSVTPSISLFGSYQRLQGTYTTFSYLVIFVTILTNMRSRNQVNRFVTTIILASLPISLYGLLQKFQIDPIPWGGNVSVRVAANLGNSIFVAAYMIMVFPLTAGRILESFKEILADNGNNTSRNLVVRQIIKATIYVFIGALEIIAIYMSGSRGPMLGLLAGMYILLLLLSIYWKQRWFTIVTVGLAVVGAIFLFVFNLNNGPLDALKKSPAIGRFGKLLDPESNSALVRQYIWEGTVDLVGIHEPLNFPDGSSDKFNFLRPLIGYGPESMYVAYNQFYQPDLGRVEKRNASPDRAHNETWDSIIITGLAGLVVYLTIFSSIFYYGLRWLGLIHNKRDKLIMLIFVIGGGVIGAITLILLKGIEFLGVGLPFGMLIGVILYLTIYALFSYKNRSILNQQNQHYLLLIVLFAAIVAHFIEINFGIAIVATRTLFWSYTALMVVIGYILPRVEQTETQVINNDDSEELKSMLANRKKLTRKLNSPKRKTERNSRPIIGDRPEWVRNALIGAFLVGILLTTLGFNYISNSSQSDSAIAILIDAYTRLRNNENSFSPGIFVLITITWIVSSLLLTVAREKSKDENLVSHFGIVAAGSLVIGLLFWILHAISLALISGFTPTDQNGVLIQVNNIGSLLTKYYIYIFLLIILLAFIIPAEWPKKKTFNTSINLLISPIVIIILLVLVNITNLKVIQADITFKTAEPFTKSNQWQVVTFLYKRALELAPREDHYYLFLGRSYLEQAKLTEEIQDQDNLVTQAEKDLKVAQTINPLNTDHTANLARLYSWWASISKTTGDLITRGEQASAYYASAVTLSPNNSTLWDEWAILFMQILGDNQEALLRLQHALSLDDRYSFTQGLIGDYYMRVGNSLEDVDSKIKAIETAVKYYQSAAELAKKTDTTSKATYLVSIGNTYILLDGLENKNDRHEYLYQAENILIDSLDSGVSSSELWKVEEVLAKIYLKLGDKPRALEYANQAIASAPNSMLARIQDLIEQIKQLP